MTTKGKSPEALLELAAEMLKSDILPSLPPEKRYAAAMVSNAIDIARRGIAAEEEAAGFLLLDTFYTDGDGTLAQLAADFRTGAISDARHSDLRQRLRAHLITELKVRNPRFLASRGVKT